MGYVRTVGGEVGRRREPRRDGVEGRYRTAAVRIASKKRAPFLRTALSLRGWTAPVGASPAEETSEQTVDHAEGPVTPVIRVTHGSAVIGITPVASTSITGALARAVDHPIAAPSPRRPNGISLDARRMVRLSG